MNKSKQPKPITDKPAHLKRIEADKTTGPDFTKAEFEAALRKASTRLPERAKP